MKYHPIFISEISKDNKFNSLDKYLSFIIYLLLQLLITFIYLLDQIILDRDQLLKKIILKISLELNQNLVFAVCTSFSLFLPLHRVKSTSFSLKILPIKLLLQTSHSRVIKNNEWFTTEFFCWIWNLRSCHNQFFKNLIDLNLGRTNILEVHAILIGHRVTLPLFLVQIFFLFSYFGVLLL